MYACCHPDISQENQITFILKSLCGFSTKEVARTFLTTEDTISKRLYRTKEYFRAHKIRPSIPFPEEISSRTSVVLSAIYLMFNEGYSATTNNQLIRKDIISQSMWLCKSLLERTSTSLPEVYALMALMLFHTARIDSRISEEGALILLSDQDRSIWNSEFISKGSYYLNKASFGTSLSTYHIEAAIAYEHCTANSYETTNWNKILKYYDLLLSLDNDPVVFLNRCLIVTEVYGAQEALKEIETIRDHKIIKKYYLYHAILGEIYERLQNTDKAVTSYEHAIQRTQSKPEKQLLQKKIERILS